MTKQEATALKVGDRVRLLCLSFVNNSTGRVMQAVQPSDTSVSVRYFDASGAPQIASFFFDELEVAYAVVP